MPTAEARLATDRASRYLVQLCSHLGRMDRMDHHPHGGHGAHGGHAQDPTAPAVQHVDHTDTHGIVRFADGRWTLHATADTLTLRVDADDEAALSRLRDGISERITRIGRRDGLKAHWHPVAADDRSPAEPDGAGGTTDASQCG
ncbi:hypothetical protein SAMN05216223_12696 [Actinacidiphila yanglinensis]|uniref:DUF2218 domain-containing protein n=1 Tax=Actinacidiphila yanglinensis TaxID=310779 RepID=A0A1H6E7E9_9ACTN|nr:DUF2218 domain-containing protein [Actinacidiphila yanglinensis]SEG92785.1 hypothetical protein SAMN05216223_12696 [Actinacidiphila yanglinensis]